jgi:hypothetical protein
MTEIRPNYFVELTEKEINAKNDLILEYVSQSGRYYFNSDFNSVRFYGRITNKEYCEPFEIIRMFV